MTPLSALPGALLSLPVHPLVEGPTPLHRAPRLEAALAEQAGVDHGVRIHLKRDDLTGVGLGGNKLRKLELLLGDAVEQGADTVVTVGALQSNHARLTAASAPRAGLACELVLRRSVPRDDPDYTASGNLLLDDVLGVPVHVVDADVDMLAAAERRADELRGEGRRPYVIPSGGSSPLGALGYAFCAAEVLLQAADLRLDLAEVVVANGSHGTHAGLVAGLVALGADPTLARSFTVLEDEDVARAGTEELVAQSLALLGLDPPGPGAVVLDGSQRGAAYGVPTDQMLAALRLLARTEGLFVDPVYSGKALAGLLTDVVAGRYPHGSDVVFVMTGGTPGLFAYREALREPRW